MALVIVTLGIAIGSAFISGVKIERAAQVRRDKVRRLWAK